MVGCVNVSSGESAEVDESSGRVNMRALSSETNTGKLCNVQEMRRETKRTAVHMKLFSTSPDL